MLKRSTILRGAGPAALAALLAPVLAPVLVLGTPAPARAEVSAQEAADFVQRAGGRLAATIGGAGSIEEKRRRIAKFMAEGVVVDGVARFCLGRFWRGATPEQRDAYLRLFNEVLANSIAGRLGQYEGEAPQVVVGRPEQRDDGIYVPTTITRPNNQPFRVTWLVTTAGGRPRIGDVIAEGMSLRLVQRNDYASFIARNGNDVGALIRALEGQVSRGAGIR